MQIERIVPDGERMWCVEYLREDGHRIYSYWPRDKDHDEIAVYRRFMKAHEYGD